MNLYDYEKRLKDNYGFSTICGTDEAGRGPLAGSVFAAAVALNGATIEGLDDSKKITPVKREKLYTEICSKAQYAVASASVGEIEKYNILDASQLAMRRAVDALCGKLKIDAVLVDGNIAREFSLPSICVVGGDRKCASIAAASIIAKVTRDREMAKLDVLYPGYGFAKHKGYPTKQHYEAIAELGPSPVHRMSFLKKFYKRQQEQLKQQIERSADRNSTLHVSRGTLGENTAIRYLEQKGYKFIERNFHSHFGEIDLILVSGEYLVFVEVKLRKNRQFADAAEYVDLRKIHKIRKTAEYWLMTHNTSLQPRFDVIEIYDDGRLTEDTCEVSDFEINHIIGAF
ncbi:MAG: ribonuclease HII [Eubacteriales bacterium]|jgi:ribonuclease HII